MSLSITGTSPHGKEKSAAQKKMEQCTAEQAWNLLEEKFSSRFRSVREAWIRMDADNDGFITMPEMKDAMTAMGVTMSGHELRRLWRMFDTSGDGRISYLEFSNRVGVMISPPNNGLQMPRRPQTPSMPDYKLKALAATLRRKIESIEETFAEMDLDQSGEISHAEFIQALRKLGMRGIGDAESFNLMARFKLPSNMSGNMTLAEFRACVTSLMRIEGGDAVESGAATLRLKEAEEALSACPRLPRSNKDVVMASLAAFDEEGLGDLTEPQFKTALAALGVSPLTPEQFGALWGKYNAVADDSIGILEFAGMYCAGGGRRFSMGSADLHGNVSVFRPWARMGLRPFADTISGKPLEFKKQSKLCAAKHGLNDAEGLVVITCIGRIAQLEAAFKVNDKEGLGELSRLEFKRALESMGVDFDEMTIQALVSKFDRNKNGRLGFREFTQQMGRYMTLSDFNLTAAYLEPAPGQEALLAAARSGVVPPPPAAPKAAPVPWATVEAAAAEGATSRSRSTAGGAGPSSVSHARAARPPYAEDDARSDDGGRSLPTAALDLGAVAGRINRVLGKGAIASLASEVKAASSAASGGRGRGAQASGPPSVEDGGVVPGEVLRDALAQRGVALTAKEVRALALKYGSAGGVDVDKLVAALGTLGVGGEGKGSGPAARLAASMAARGQLSASVGGASTLSAVVRPGHPGGAVAATAAKGRNAAMRANL